MLTNGSIKFRIYLIKEAFCGSKIYVKMLKKDENCPVPTNFEKKIQSTHFLSYRPFEKPISHYTVYMYQSKTRETGSNCSNPPPLGGMVIGHGPPIIQKTL